MKRFRVPSINFSINTQKSRHDELVHLVEQMLALHHRQSTVRTPQEMTALERPIAALDREIDSFVYELYGLTEADIKLIEGCRQ